MYICSCVHKDKSKNVRIDTTRTHAHTCIYRSTYMFVDTCTCIPKRTYMCTYKYKCLNACTHPQLHFRFAHRIS